MLDFLKELFLSAKHKATTGRYCQCCGISLEMFSRYTYGKGGEEVFLCSGCNYDYQHYWARVKDRAGFFQALDK